jgi:mannose-6-phosphate isomerase-like protein (cupin superfamily)
MKRSYDSAATSKATCRLYVGHAGARYSRILSSEQGHPYSLRAGDGERLAFAGAEFLVKASAETTGGAFAIIEEIDPLDTPLHVHENEDELFYVIEGEHVFTVGDEELEGGPGAVVFAPRRVPHAHRRVVPRTGRFLTMVSPAGLEGFFRQLSEAESAGGADEEAYLRASESYGITWLS